MSLAFDDQTRTLLQSFGFDLALFDKLRDQHASAQGSPSGILQGHITPPTADDISSLPSVGSSRYIELEERGRAAIAAGEIASVVLAGGMATRFGGVVKAAVPVHDGMSFLDLKLADARRAARATRGRIPVFVMTSFATHAVLDRLLKDVDDDWVEARVFPQFVSVRLDPSGDVFRGADGRPSPYAMGHGDLPFALRASGLLGEFRARGGRALCMSNVDNLTASIDPALIGWHLEGEQRITVEVTDKNPGDKGGAPARVDGVLQIVEGFRFPPSFDQDGIPVFNTNTLTFDADALDTPCELDFFAVRKRVEEREVIQFERLVGQLTAFIESAYLRVPREGPGGRFHPVKDPDELESRLPDILVALKARGVL